MTVEENIKIMEELDKTTKEVQDLKHQLDIINKDVSDMKTDIKGLLLAWNTATGVATFLKWLAGIGIAINLLWEPLKRFFH